jgi:hypothetical protein
MNDLESRMFNALMESIKQLQEIIVVQNIQIDYLKKELYSYRVQEDPDKWTPDERPPEVTTPTTRLP